ncbi:MAG TPA: GNAT family N-acetyltransferase [Candidatus Sulfopaludibacter sp.]|nr:GNAT family N-acetyltransferase [Candidatus Sulfopaludibacter sp.]
MSALTASEVTIRPATAEDIPACAEICFQAFRTINESHGFPPDFPVPEAAAGVLTAMFTNPNFYCVVAEIEGRAVGSNCMDERSVIFGIGPITVDPAAQNRGVGRKLMQAALDRATEQRAAGVRLVQAAFHTRSLSLYAGLGFQVREPLACMQGTTKMREIPGCKVRAAHGSDAEACLDLCTRVHGFARRGELHAALHESTAVVVERGGRVTGYATALAFMAHAVGETNTDLQALIASAESFGGPGILIPIRNSGLFQWCLASGLRVTQPLTLMSLGLYNEPAGAFLPSILF